MIVRDSRITSFTDNSSPTRSCGIERLAEIAPFGGKKGATLFTHLTFRFLTCGDVTPNGGRPRGHGVILYFFRSFNGINSQ